MGFGSEEFLGFGVEEWIREKKRQGIHEEMANAHTKVFQKEIKRLYIIIWIFFKQIRIYINITNVYVDII